MPRPLDAIVFDAFGTLVHIQRPARPYAALRTLLTDRGADTAGFALEAMTRRRTLADLARATGLPVPPQALAALEAQVIDEVESIAPFPDAAAAVARALEVADRVVIGSNLGWPYGAPVERFLAPWGPVAALDDDAPDARVRTAFSFDVGHVKPDPAFYAHVARRLSALSGKPAASLALCMVGDKQAEDGDGPTRAGWRGWRMDRAAGQGLLDAPWWPR